MYPSPSQLVYPWSIQYKSSIKSKGQEVAQQLPIPGPSAKFNHKKLKARITSIFLSILIRCQNTTDQILFSCGKLHWSGYSWTWQCHRVDFTVTTQYINLVSGMRATVIDLKNSRKLSITSSAFRKKRNAILSTAFTLLRHFRGI